MYVTSLCSSSTFGNCYAITAGGKTLLVDCGSTNRYLRSALADIGVLPGDLLGCLVTHSHPDHTRSLLFLMRNDIPVFAGEKTAALLPRSSRGSGHVHVLGEKAHIPGDFRVTRMDVPHYAADGSSCFVIGHGDESVAVITDAGVLDQHVLRITRGVTYILCESNHDEGRAKSGVPFPGGQWRPLSVLRDKSLGPKGHLSNEQAAAFLSLAATQDTRGVMLCHLSEDYNRPDIAMRTVGQVLQKSGWEGALGTAAPNKMTGPLTPSQVRFVV